MHLVFRFSPEANPQSALKLKVEINTREHASLFGTKLRALLQRRKNRDLFDLGQGLEQLNMNVDRLLACFDHYLALEGTAITLAFERIWVTLVSSLKGYPWKLTDRIIAELRGQGHLMLLPGLG